MAIYPKYFTNSGIPCTEEETRLIDSLKRLSKRWEKDGEDLMLFSWAGSLKVVKKSAINDRHFEDAIVEDIYGITNDAGDPV